MSVTNRLKSPEVFSSALYEVMISVHPGILDLDLNEFRYALENLLPEAGWDTVGLDGIFLDF